MLLVLVYYFVDFTFLAQTKAHYQTEAQLANFLGPFLDMLETGKFRTTTWLSSRLITRYSLRVNMMMHPIGLMVCRMLMEATKTRTHVKQLLVGRTALT